jgi:autotransporter-associated beta strand protein
LSNSITFNGGNVYGADGGQHLTGPIAIGAAGSFMGEQQTNKYLFLDGPLSGSGGITNPVPGQGYPGGAGPLFITSSGNSYSGTFTLTSGALGIQDTAGTAVQNAIVNLMGFTPGIPFVTNDPTVGYSGLQVQSPIIWTSNLSFTITLGGLAGTVDMNIDANYGVALILGNNRSDTSSYSGSLGGGVYSSADNVTKVGSGTQWLIGTNTYSSATYISSGTLGISTLHAGNGDFNIADGATLAITNGNSALSALVNNLNAGVSSSAHIAFYNLTNRLTLTNAPLTAQTLSPNGTVFIDVVSGGPFAVGQTYPLIRYTSSGGTGGFAVGQFTRSLTAVIATNDNGDGTYTLELSVVGGGAPDRWTGNQNNIWDINTSANWFAGGGNSTYLDGDGVRFDDTSATQNVNLAISVNPNNIIVTNNTKNYTITGGGAIAGAANLVKYGAGTLTLTNLANTFSGGVTILGGTVVVDVDTSLGAASVGVVLSNATLSVLSTSTGNRPLSINAANIAVASGQTLTVNGAVANYIGTGSLVKSGNGMLTLDGANTYTGSTTVSNGTLSITFAQQGGGAITVKDGATLKVVGNGTVSVPSSSLTLGVSGASTIGLSGVSGVAVVNATNFTANGTVTINVGSVSGTGQFPMIKYTGTIGGAGYGAFSLGTLPLGASATLVNNSANHSVDLNVTSLAPVTWSGNNGPAWDIATTTNWLFGSTNEVYTDGESVLFGDSAASSSVNVTMQVSPSGILVSNSIPAFTFSTTNAGVGIGGGGSLRKAGSNLLLFQPMTNTFGGGTVIANGTLELATVTNITRQELGSGSITISNNSLLQLDGLGGSTNVYPVYLPNAIMFNGGRLNANDGGEHLTGIINIGASGAGVVEPYANKYVYFDSAVSGGGTVTIPAGGIGAGFGGFGPVQFTCPTNAYSGTMTLNNGQLGIEDTNGTALAFATVNLTGFNASINLAISNTPVTWLNNLSGSLAFGGLGGTVALNLNDARMPAINTLTLGNSSNAYYSGALSGVFNLNKIGSSTQALVGTNTYIGSTVISNGTLVISTLHAGFSGFTVKDGAGLSITNTGGSSSAAVASLMLGSSTLGFQHVASTTTPLVTSGGTLTVNGATTIAIADATGLLTTNVYPLITASGITGSGSFSLTLPAGITANLVTNGGNTLALNVTAIAPLVNTNRPHIQVSVSANTLSLGWPTNLGWTLLTNSVGLTATNQWFPYPGSASITNVSITINPAKTNVFFRMAYPYP